MDSILVDGLYVFIFSAMIDTEEAIFLCEFVLHRSVITQSSFRYPINNQPLHHLNHLFLYTPILSYFTFNFGSSGVSFSLCIATSAPFLPDKSIDPNVGPIRGRPFVSVTDIPTAIKPGKTSSV
jgi:hypothetical protein